MFGRRKKSSPTLSARQLAQGLHKDTRWLYDMFGDLLEPGETIDTYFECPARDGRGDRLLVPTSRYLRYVDDLENAFAFPYEALVGFRTKAGYVRFAFQGPNGVMSPITVFIGGGPEEVIAFRVELAKGWKRATGTTFSADEMRASPHTPEIELRPMA